MKALMILIVAICLTTLTGCAIEYGENGRVRSVKVLEPTYSTVEYEYGYGYYRPVYRRYHRPRVVYERRTVIVRESVRHSHRSRHDDCR